MPRNRKARRQAAGPQINTQQPKPRKPRQRSKRVPRAAGIGGSGMYSMLAPLARMAVQAAMPAAMGKAAQLLRPSSSTIRGSGDYVTNDIVHSSDSLPSKKGNAGVPQTRFTHSEYITDVLVGTTPAAFNATRYTINPADSGTFPWLSRLASLYTKYRFTKLLFEFRSNTSNYSAAGALGTVVLAPQYNPDAQPFPSKQIMEAATHAVSTAPSNSVLMGFECAKQDAINQWYVILNDNTMARSNFSDLGAFTLATSGLPGTAGTSLGELWVHYTCDLIEPYISVTDSVSTGPLALVSGFIQTAGNAATFSTGSFGLQNSAMAPMSSSYFAATPGNFQLATKTSTSSLPTGSSWFICCSGDANPQFGFRLAGTYEITLKARISSTPTTTTGAPYDLTANTGTLVSVMGNNAGTLEIGYSTPSAFFAYRWVVTVSGLTGLTTTADSGFTGMSGNMSFVAVTVVKIA